MYLSGFPDEAATTTEGQIRLIRELGWRHIDLRRAEGRPLNELDDAALERVAGLIADAGVTISCLASTIADRNASISNDFCIDQAETERWIEVCKLFGCTRMRVMSWPPEGDRAIDGPTAAERIRRLRWIHDRCADAGINALHENCHNYGGQSADHTLRLIDEIPGLRLIFDTANPINSDDWSYACEPKPKQSVYEFWAKVRDNVAYIHIKDGVFDPAGDKRWQHCFPGEGMGDVRAVLKDAIARGYDDAIAIEPHVGKVHLLPNSEAMSDEERKQANFLAYGRRTAAILADLGVPIPDAALPVG